MLYTIQEKCLLLQILMLFIFPYPVQNLNKISKIIVILFGILSVVVVLIYLYKDFKIYKSIFLIFLFQSIIFLSLMFANNIPMIDFFRGIIPFLYYIYIPIFKKNPKIKTEIFLKILLLISLCYSLRILFYWLIYCYNTNMRVTFFLSKATSGIPLIGLLFSIYLLILKKRLIYAFVTLMIFFSIIITETKGMLLSSVIGFTGLYFSLTLGKLKKIKFILIILTLFATLFFTDFSRRYRNIIDLNVLITKNEIYTNDKGSIDIRLTEIKKILTHFRESPLLGKGMGFKWDSEEIYGNKVLYSHNFIAYILLNFGIIGMVYLSVTIFYILKILKKLEKERIIKFYFSVMLTIFIYSNIFAYYRQIECSLILSMIIGFYIKKYEEILFVGEKIERI